MNYRARIIVLGFLPAIAILIYSVAASSFPQQGQNPPRNKLGMEFVRIQPGEFMMGCSPNDTACAAEESPRHRVQITRGFEIGKFEVTQAQWIALMRDNPSGNKGDTLPVETVSKLEAQDFVAKLNTLNDGYRYRLPTEAEWEYAARAGSDSPYSGTLDLVAWYAGNSEDETHPVGLKKPNAWGLYDVQGNVREWVSDYYDGTYYSKSPLTDPTGPQLGATAGGLQGAGPGGRGGPGGGGARGGPGFVPPPPPPPPLVPFPAGGTPQQQIDALRQQVQQLQLQLQQLRNDFQTGPPRGGPGLGPPGGPLGPPPQGPIVVINGQLVDPLDGLPTGLPVIRGGGWDQSAGFQRVSSRYTYYGPTLRVSDIGFRVVRVPVAQENSR